jgi:hypothetical protein
MGETMRTVLQRLLAFEHMTIEELAARSGFGAPSIKACLYRYRDQSFARLPSGNWEVLPISSTATGSATDTS